MIDMKKTNILFSLSLLIVGFGLVFAPSSAFAYGEYGNYNNGYGSYNNGYAGNTNIAGNGCYTSCGYNNNYNNGFGNNYNYNNGFGNNYNNGFGNYTGLARW